MKKATFDKIAWFMVICFIISLLPVLYCSLFDYASGDDLWEGAAAYRVLAEHGTIKEFFSEIYRWAKTDYNAWEGNWSSIILWCLEPSIWGEKVYCITPWIALFSLCGGSIYFLFHYLKKYLTGNTAFLIIISVIVCFFSVQYMPYIRGGIFWYTGMINYTFPYGLCLASFVWMDKFIKTGKKCYLIFTSVFFAYLGGSGYITIVLAFELLCFIILSNMFWQKNEQKFRPLWLLIPLILLITGFIFSAISPGNAARGGEEYYLGFTKIFMTIFESIKQGFLGGVGWFISVRPLVLTMPLIFITTWELIDVNKIKWKFKHPVIVIAFLFLISCSVYAPGIYAQNEVSGGVPDTIYFVFILMYTFGIIYLTLYLKKIAISKNCELKISYWLGKIRVFVLLGELVFCIVAGRYLIGNMAGYICMDFIRSGQLHDFEYQMQERLEILNNPEITNVVLPQMNSEQGPFMHFPLLDDSGAYPNKATARFYGKESVIAIPRPEYYELYGYPEEKEFVRKAK